MFKLLKRSTAQWLNEIKGLAKTYGALNDALHGVGVNVLAHAAEHGDVRPLNAFFNMMAVNHQTSYRAYIGRIFTKQPGTKCLRFTAEDGFSVITNEGNKPVNTEKERKALLKLCQTKLINPDGKEWVRFYEKDIRTEQVYLFGDEDLVKALRSLIRRAEGKQANIQSKVSKDLIPVLNNTLAKAEQHIH